MLSEQCVAVSLPTGTEVPPVSALDWAWCTVRLLSLHQSLCPAKTPPYENPRSWRWKTINLTGCQILSCGSIYGVIGRGTVTGGWIHSKGQAHGSPAIAESHLDRTFVNRSLSK